ncbi:MAG: YdcF family protein [Defluviitaleaceae bacterium]|nr:YdcF family protein [Defluviitaleaceae bacterium]
MENTIKKILIAIDVLLVISAIWLLARQGISNTFLLNFGIIFGITVYIFLFERLIKLKWLNYFIAFAAVCYLSLGIFAMIFGNINTTTFDEDVVIVLGSGLVGEEVSTVLRSRLDAALEYHSRNPSALFIVSGGQGTGHVITEALAMSRYLIDNGVPEYLIIQEGNSHSTFENMLFSHEILQQLFPGYLPFSPIYPYSPSIVVITNDFHIFRAVNFTRIVGIGEATSFSANTPLISLPGALIREVAAIVKMWIIGT